MDTEIEHFSMRRQQAWASGNTDEVARITSRLADLYEERRRQRAQDGYRDRAEIIRRARVESELERMIVGR